MITDNLVLGIAKANRVGAAFSLVLCDAQPISVRVGFEVAGEPSAMALADGLVFVAASGGGLAVLNVMSLDDTQGHVDTILLEHVPQVIEGMLLLIAARSGASGLLRQVDFFVDGRFFGRDSSPPFEVYVPVPRNVSSMSLQAFGEDFSFQRVSSAIGQVAVLPDTVPPAAVGFRYENNTVTVQFDEMVASVDWAAFLCGPEEGNATCVCSPILIGSASTVVSVGATSLLLINGAPPHGTNRRVLALAVRGQDRAGNLANFQTISLPGLLVDQRIQVSASTNFSVNFTCATQKKIIHAYGSAFEFDGVQARSLPGMRLPHGAGCAVTFHGKVFITGGVSSSTIVESFDGTSWYLEPPMPRPHDYHGCAVFRGGLYVVAGSSSGWRDPVDWVDRFDGQSWQAMPPVRCPRSTGKAAVLNDALYLIGGDYGLDYYVPPPRPECVLPNGFIVERFNGTSWEFAPFPNVAKIDGGVAVHGGRIFASGWSPQQSHVIEAFDGSTWKVVAQTPWEVGNIALLGNLLHIWPRQDSNFFAVWDVINQPNSSTLVSSPSIGWRLWANVAVY